MPPRGKPNSAPAVSVDTSKSTLPLGAITNRDILAHRDVEYECAIVIHGRSRLK